MTGPKSNLHEKVKCTNTHTKHNTHTCTRTTQDFPQPFITFPYSLLKTMIMTVGEFETDPIFFSDPSDSVLSYPTVTYILWVLFLIIMPVLLQNLLVSYVMRGEGREGGREGGRGTYLTHTHTCTHAHTHAHTRTHTRLVWLLMTSRQCRRKLL